MRRVTNNSVATAAKKASATLRKHGVKLTLGGEPSYVPADCSAAEWSITAVGPTKLNHAYAFADALIARALPGAVAFFSPGKAYPGEVNPRWALHLLWNRDGSPLLSAQSAAPKSIANLKRELVRALKVRDCWIRARDLAQPKREIWVLPLDHDGTRWRSEKWPLGKSIDLINAEGSAGLRLPLNLLPETALKRALTLEKKGDKLHVFFPPLLQNGFRALLRFFNAADGVRFEGYVPGDDGNLWSKLSITPDPGVLEINLPACGDAHEYACWMQTLEESATAAGLRSYKQRGDETIGTGGGNHVLFGGPSLDENAFFTHPGWVTAILRYWQRHPSLSYLFTGDYVGPSSQAPRPDESARPLYDLEMAYRFLESQPAGVDQRHLISETLRHLHTDGSGNTHRSEISFDKFWNASWEGGCRGLIEFRAVEAMPRASWMSAVAALWQALAAMLFEKNVAQPLVEHGSRLHDFFFLPTLLWSDFEEVLRDLSRDGFALDAEIFREIWDWRFPQMLAYENKSAQLIVRRALEGWPLLCETPLEGGTTSRFVDTSMERLEFLANKKFAQAHRVFVHGRELPLEKITRTQFGAGLRYRRTALYPSLHPGIAPHMPLRLEITSVKQSWRYQLEQDRRMFQPGDQTAPRGAACKKLKPELLTYDLRIE